MYISRILLITYNKCQWIYRRLNAPTDTKNCNILFFLWFYVRLGLLYIILKVGQDCSMGKFQISMLNIFDLQVIFHYVSKH